MLRFLFKKWYGLIFVTIPLILIIIGSCVGYYFYNHYQDEYTKHFKADFIHKAKSYLVQLEYLVNKQNKKTTGREYIGQTLDKLPTIALPSIVYDINGEKIGEFAAERRSIIGLEDVSDYFILCLLAVEDRYFLSHEGINYRGILRAMKRNIESMSFVEGGSTITQQLSKLLMTEDWKKRAKNKVLYKAMEGFLALDLEKIFSKDQILLMYTNIIYFGQGQYGIENASQFFFKKPAIELDLGESSFLAGLIAGYVIFNPFRREKKETEAGIQYNVKLKDEKKLKDVMDRHKRVLLSIVKYKSLPELSSEQDAQAVHTSFWNKYVKEWSKPDAVRNTQVGLVRKTNPDMEYIMEEVFRELTQYNDEMADLLMKGGLTIKTTIDQRKQKMAQKIVRKHISKYKKECRKSKRFKGNSQLIQGALISVDPITGKIEAMVGGTGYHRTKKNGQLIRTHQARRQVGSAFKPILYETAMEMPIKITLPPENNFSPYLMMEDKKSVKIKLPGTRKTWTVKNYGRGEGIISLKRALQKSSNTVAAQLIEKIGRIGIDNLRNFLASALDLSLNPDDRNSINRRFPANQYSMALGAKEMTPLELATVFSIIANKGRKLKPFVIERVEDLQGNTIFEYPIETSEQLLIPQSCYLTLYMMSEILKPGGTGYRAFTNAGFRTNVSGDQFVSFAGKTGTSQKNRDAWFVGIIPDLVTIVWVGHDENRPLIKAGGQVAAPIWAEYMKLVTKYYKKIGKFKQEDFDYSPKIEGLLYVPSFKNFDICRKNGSVCLDNMCPADIIDPNVPFISGTEPLDICQVSESGELLNYDNNMTIEAEEGIVITQNDDDSDADDDENPNPEENNEEI